MNKVILPLVFSSVFIALSGCEVDDENKGGEMNQDPISTCLGFSSPGINIFVKDSLNDSIKIENAVINVYSQDGDDVTIDQPLYIGQDDGLSNSLTDAYYSSLSHNSGAFDVSIVVEAAGYHTFVTKGIEFEVDTTCMADNNINYDVYLCEVGTTCL